MEKSKKSRSALATPDRNWGGARPGAGRKKGEPKKQVYLYLPIDVAEKISQKGRDWIVELVRAN